MTTKELINKYPAWICEGDKRYVAVKAMAGKENALKIANSVFKVKSDRLRATPGIMGGNYIYKRAMYAPKNVKENPVWIVEVV